jgi:formylglycine-generating enzyme required for sulfatase activity
MYLFQKITVTLEQKQKEKAMGRFFDIIILGFIFSFFATQLHGSSDLMAEREGEKSPMGNSGLKIISLHISEITNIRVTSAECKAEFQLENTPDKIERGICWSEDEKPTIEDSRKVVDHQDTPLEAKISGLKKGTVYHIRPYLKTNEQVHYGEQISFATNSLVNGVPVEMKYIEGGTYSMGCISESHNCYGDEYPVHAIQVESFQMSTYEITTKQYCAFMNERGVDKDGNIKGVSYIDVNDSDCPIQFLSTKGFFPKSGKADYPVTEVTWKGAKAFCEWIGGRLPTEAEWEYAARGGKKSKNYKYAGSNNIEDVAWYERNSSKTCHPVGQKAPNELGLYDMSGNVWEWCRDWYGFYEEQTENHSGPESGFERILRGGSMNMDDWNCRVTNRSSKAPEFTYNYFGFRCVIPAN